MNLLQRMHCGYKDQERHFLQKDFGYSPQGIPEKIGAGIFYHFTSYLYFNTKADELEQILFGKKSI